MGYQVPGLVVKRTHSLLRRPLSSTLIVRWYLPYPDSYAFNVYETYVETPYCYSLTRISMTKDCFVSDPRYFASYYIINIFYKVLRSKKEVLTKCVSVLHEISRNRVYRMSSVSKLTTKNVTRLLLLTIITPSFNYFIYTYLNLIRRMFALFTLE